MSQKNELIHPETRQGEIFRRNIFRPDIYPTNEPLQPGERVGVRAFDQIGNRVWDMRPVFGPIISK